MRRVFLSHFLDSESPLYGGEAGISIESVKSMACGDSCNALRVSMPCHAGTHVDLPSHFVKGGKTLDDFSAEDWVFRQVGVLELEDTLPEQRLGPSLLEGASLPVDLDLLLLRTGFGRHRGQDLYWQRGPIIEPDLAPALRARFPALRALGLDTISLSSWMDRPTGRVAHRAFLEGTHPILIIEDMDFSGISAGTEIHQVLAAPLLLRHADGVPCTVIAEVAS